MIWVVVVAIALIAMAVLLRPLFVPGATASSRQAQEIAIYRDQLAALDREIETGLVPADEADAARVEIERKILAAAARQDSAEADAVGGGRWPRLAAAALIAAVTPLAALAAYLLMGAPNVPGHPFAARTPVGPETDRRGVAEIDGLVRQLAARLEQEPNNLEGWKLLARSYGALQRHGDAAAAYGRAFDLAPTDMAVAADLAEALTYAAGGIVPPRALSLFEQANKGDPSAPKPRFYLAVSRAQAGKSREAIAMLKSLEFDSPADAPWLPAVRELMASIARESGIDAGSIESQGTAPVAAAPAPDADGAASGTALEGMSEDQLAMVRNMVDGLAQRLQANPDDLEGWRRLGRSYLVLNEPAGARDAYGRAVALAPADAGLLADYAAALLAAPDAAPTLAEPSISALRELLTREPDNGAALWLLGFAERAGNKDSEARALWARLLEQLDPASPEHAAVRAQIDALPAQN